MTGRGPFWYDGGMELDFAKGGGLIPAIIQDAQTGKVLMLGYMNEESLRITQEKGLVTFWSRTRNKLWTKGETSGHFLKVRSITPDCDRDTLLIKAVPNGPVCHTGQDTCFGEDNQPASLADLDFLTYLGGVIKDRKEHPVPGSYTDHLFSRGLNQIAKKVGEEAVETIIASKDDNDEDFLGEAADLVYHLMVLLCEKGYALEDVAKVLQRRHSR